MNFLQYKGLFTALRSNTSPPAISMREVQQKESSVESGRGGPRSDSTHWTRSGTANCVYIHLGSNRTWYYCCFWHRFHSATLPSLKKTWFEATTQRKEKELDMRTVNVVEGEGFKESMHSVNTKFSSTKKDIRCLRMRSQAFQKRTKKKRMQKTEDILFTGVSQLYWLVWKEMEVNIAN